MTLIQQARALESRIEALEARSGMLDGDGGLLSELRGLRGTSERLGAVESAIVGLPVIEERVADFSNQGDPRPQLEALASRLDALEASIDQRLGEQAAAAAEMSKRLVALEKGRRFKPVHGLVWLLSTTAAGVVAWRNGLEPLMVAGVTVAAGIAVGAWLRSGD